MQKKKLREEKEKFEKMQNFVELAVSTLCSLGINNPNWERLPYILRAIGEKRQKRSLAFFYPNGIEIGGDFVETANWMFFDFHEPRHPEIHFTGQSPIVQEMVAKLLGYKK